MEVLKPVRLSAQVCRLAQPFDLSGGQGNVCLEKEDTWLVGIEVQGKLGGSL